MTLKQKSILITVGTVLALSVAFVLVAYFIIIPKFQTVENQRAERNSRRISAIIEDRFFQLRLKLSDWSSWDDTYKFMRDLNKEYVISNLSLDSFKNIGVDEALFIGREGGLVASVDDGKNSYSFFATGSALLKIKEGAENHSQGLIKTERGILFFVARNVYKTDLTGPYMGTVVFVKNLDQEVLDAVKELTQFETRMVLWDDQGMSEDFSEVKRRYGTGKKDFVKTLDEKTISGYLVIEDFFGKPQAIVRSDVGRDISILGIQAVKTVSGAVGVTVLIIGLNNYWLLYGLILKKVTDMSSEAENLGKKEATTERLSLGNTSDEVDTLRLRINKMLESLQFTRLAMESTSNHIVITDPDGKITYANKAAVAQTGYRLDQMLGKTPRLWGGQMSEDFYRELWNTIKNKKQIYKGEITNKRSSGELYTAMSTITPILDSTGGLIGFVAIEDDITERKRIEKEKSEYLIKIEKLKEGVEKEVEERTKELSVTNARFISAINSVPRIFLVLDKNLELVLHNNKMETVLKTTSNEWNLDILDSLVGRKNNLIGIVKNVLVTKKAVTTKDLSYGSSFLSIYAGPVFVENSEELLGVVVTIEDVTEKNALDRSKDEFFSIASHELRTPLTAIRGNTSMVLDYYKEALKDPELKAMITDTHDASVRLISIVNDFLDVSRLEQGKMQYAIADVEVVEVINKVVKDLAESAKSKGVKLVVVGDKKIQVKADPGKVEQIIFNIVGNSLKFTDKGSVTIKVVDNVSERMVTIEVIDTGLGIPVANQNILFHKFQQAGSSLITRDGAKGTGLGLYISRLMAEGMGGKLELIKSEEGKGSVFGISLPLK